MCIYVCVGHSVLGVGLSGCQQAIGPDWLLVGIIASWVCIGGGCGLILFGVC